MPARCSPTACEPLHTRDAHSRDLIPRPAWLAGQSGTETAGRSRAHAGVHAQARWGAAPPALAGSRVWIALLVAALPLAMRQSDHLRGGGFDVPGSPSKAVADAHRPRLPRRGAHAARRRPRAAAGRAPRCSCARRSRASPTRPPARRRRRADAGRPRRGRPRRRRGAPVRRAAAKSPCREDSVLRRGQAPARASARRRRPARRRGDAPDRPGRAVGGAAGGLQDGPRQGRVDRLPDRAADPARGVRVVRRGRAAARTGRRLGAHHRRRHLPALAVDGHVGVRHEHGLDDRDRRGGGLLAVRPRPLPRGDPGGAGRDGGARDRDGDVRASPSPSPA